MEIKRKVNFYTFTAIAILLAIEIIILYLADVFNVEAMLFILGPLALFIFTLVWLYKIGGIICPKCNNIYGITFSGFISWPIIPDKCVSCGYNPKETIS